jgi:hypothetical protein
VCEGGIQQAGTEALVVSTDYLFLIIFALCLLAFALPFAILMWMA